MRSAASCAVALYLLALLPSASDAQTLAIRTCTGVVQELTLSGVITLERWVSVGSYRYYGRFLDPAENVYEFEVFTGRLDGGVGGLWLNGMRHRETFINLAVDQEGFMLRGEDGTTAAFGCPTSPGTSGPP